MTRPTIVFAHGAGAPSTSEWMLGWTERLGSLGAVLPFDYPYMAARKRRPDPLPALVAAHRRAVESAGKARQVVFAGKSMGGRIGCHLSLEVEPSALVCFGFPLVSQSGASRREVLLALRAPILFVQGTRDRLCPLDELEKVRTSMSAPNALHVVDEGDHSLIVTKRRLAREQTTQRAVDAATLVAVARFLSEHASAP